MVSQDAGESWNDATGNLVNATGTTAKARPSGLLLVDVDVDVDVDVHTKAGVAKGVATGAASGAASGAATGSLTGTRSKEQGKAAQRKVALLVGTSTGVFVSWTDRPGQWARLGSCSNFPMVLTLGLSHERTSDTLVAATMGRGVYTMTGLGPALARLRVEQVAGMCT